MPTFLAFLLNSFGIIIFLQNSKPGCEPLVSCLIFLFAVFLLLWDLRLYPTSLRKLSKSCAYLFQFFVAAFLMEHIMNDFWFPLEASLMALLKKLPEMEKDFLSAAGSSSSGILQFLDSDMSHVIASYALSLFFFFCVLHATRIVDFRYGFSAFFEDINYRFRCQLSSFKNYISEKYNSFASPYEVESDMCFCKKCSTRSCKGRKKY